MGTRPASAFRHEIRISWADCDPAKIAYTGRIPYWALDAIDAWWEKHLGGGWYQMELDRNVGTPFVRLEVDFTSPVTPRHRLVCHVWPTRLGTSSIAFQVEGEQDGKLCFTARTVSVFTRADAFVKQAPPDDIRAILAPYLAEATGD